jgi:DNA-binding response OmpR family regulator
MQSRCVCCWSTTSTFRGAAAAEARGQVFAVDFIAGVNKAMVALKAWRWDIIVRHLGLPDADGLDVWSICGGADTTPVLILTAQCHPTDRITGLQSGADDYLGKPFTLEKLVVHLQAVLRRPGSFLDLVLKLGNLTLDAAARQVFVGYKTDCIPCTRAARARIAPAVQRPGRHQITARRQSVHGPTQGARRMRSRFRSTVFSSTWSRPARRYRSRPYTASATW